MTSTPRVLVVDGLAETETVLRAVLEPQGARVERHRSSVSMTNTLPPEVLVVDVDDQHSAAFSVTAWPNVPRVVLGSIPAGDDLGETRFLEKPFQYPELIRVVQSLLDFPTEQRRLA